ncbi:MAG: tetratricopeptide repeat protein, partial [Planctomycetota bacterium]
PLAAVLFFGITLSPALGFLDFYFQIYSFVQDHFQYLACAGLIALLTGLVTHGLKRVHERAGVVAAGLVLVVLGGLTWQRSSYFTSQEVLWTRTLERNPGAWMADINLGLVYAGEGRFDEAADRFRKALATEHVQHDKARYNLGWVLERQGDIAGARAQYEQAIELNPVNADARNNLGLILINEGRLDEATEQFTAAIEGEPRNTRARFNLAMQQIRAGQRIEPEKHLRDAIRLDPMYKDAVEQLARLLLDQGRHEDAAEFYRHALAIQPDNYDAQFNLGLTLEALNDFPGAEHHYRNAIRLAPNLAPAYNNLAIILYRSKRYPEAWAAIRSYQAAGGTPHPDFLTALTTAHPPPR